MPDNGMDDEMDMMPPMDDMQTPPMDDSMGQMPPMGDDMGQMPPETPMPDENDGQADSDVDNDAEQATGTLGNLLPDANEPTVDYVMNAITTAVGKNPNVGDKNIDGYIEKLKGGDLDNQEESQGPDENPQMQESRKSYMNKLIHEALNDVILNRPEKRSETKFDKRKFRKGNPFISPFS